MHSSSSHAFFGAPFISWRHAELSVLPKEFPPALYWRGERSGLCQRALWSEPVWRLHSDPLTSRKTVSMPVHISSAFPFFSSSICPSCASVLFPSTWSGWEAPPTQAVVTNCLNSEWLSPRLHPLVLLKVPFSQPGTQRALFLPSCSHVFSLPPNPDGPSCSPHRGLKESYHRQLIGWQSCCICS